jgi:hypothetical protein
MASEAQVEEQLTREWATRFGMLALEKHKLYNTTWPAMDGAMTSDGLESKIAQANAAKDGQKKRD